MCYACGGRCRRYPVPEALIDICTQPLVLKAEAKIYCHGDGLERITCSACPNDNGHWQGSMGWVDEGLDGLG